MQSVECRIRQREGYEIDNKGEGDGREKALRLQLKNRLGSDPQYCDVAKRSHTLVCSREAGSRSSGRYACELL